MTALNVDQVKALTDAVLRQIVIGNSWEEIKGYTLEDLCAINQDALIDDLYDDDPRDREHRSGMVGYVEVYDTLLGTHRAAEIPPQAKA
jgi:hypothetical protein